MWNLKNNFCEQSKHKICWEWTNLNHICAWPKITHLNAQNFGSILHTLRRAHWLANRWTTLLRCDCKLNAENSWNLKNNFSKITIGEYIEVGRRLDSSLVELELAELGTVDSVGNVPCKLADTTDIQVDIDCFDRSASIQPRNKCWLSSKLPLTCLNWKLTSLVHATKQKLY